MSTQSTASERKLGWIKTTIFSLLPTLVLLVTAEIGLRIYVNYKAEAVRGKVLSSLAQRNEYQRPDPVLGYSLLPNYSDRGIHINSLGFRGPSIAPQKELGIRIVAIGDSTTFGLQGETCPYPAQLQQLLSLANREAEIEVINAGVEGYSAKYALRLLQHKITALKPDLVLTYVGWNDIYQRSPFEVNAPKYEDGRLDKLPPPASGVARALDRFYTVQFLRRVIFLELPRIKAKLGKSSEPRDVALHPDFTYAYKWRIEEMVRLIREMGARPVLMTLPTVLSEDMNQQALAVIHYPDWADSDYLLLLKVVDVINETLREIARTNDAVLIDNAKFIDSLGRDKERLFFDTCHMHCEGNTLLAQNIARELEQQKLLH